MLYSKTDLQSDLNKAIDYFGDEVKKIRTGRVAVDIINGVMVEAYGTMSPLQSVGQVIVKDSVTVEIQVWDQGAIQSVEKALQDANLGASVAVDGKIVRLKFNALTEEDRKMKVKEVNKLVEDSRISIRSIRHKYVSKVEDLEGVSEDEQERDLKEIQKEIDGAIEKVEEIAAAREKELLTI